MKQWVAHCNVEAFDGLSNLRSKPTVVVEAKTEKSAVEAAKKELTKRYKGYGCRVNSVVVVLLKEVG